MQQQQRPARLGQLVEPAEGDGFTWRAVARRRRVPERVARRRGRRQVRAVAPRGRLLCGRSEVIHGVRHRPDTQKQVAGVL